MGRNTLSFSPVENNFDSKKMFGDTVVGYFFTVNMAKEELVEQPASNVAEIVGALEDGKLPVIDGGEVGLRGASIIAEVHARLPQRQRLREAAQAHLLSVEGTELTEIEMREFAVGVRNMLDEVGGKDGLGFKVLSGKYEGIVGRLSVVLSGPNRDARFKLSGPDGSTILHANGMQIPRLILCNAKPDPRKQITKA